MVEDLEQVCRTLCYAFGGWSSVVIVINLCISQGDVAETAKKFFEESTDMPPAKTSTLSIADVSSQFLFFNNHSQVFFCIMCGICNWNYTLHNWLGRLLPWQDGHTHQGRRSEKWTLEDHSKVRKQSKYCSYISYNIDGFNFCRCTSNDLKYIIRLLKHDLRINAGPKHVWVSRWHATFIINLCTSTTNLVNINSQLYRCITV